MKVINVYLFFAALIALLFVIGLFLANIYFPAKAETVTVCQDEAREVKERYKIRHGTALICYPAGICESEQPYFYRRGQKTYIGEAE